MALFISKQRERLLNAMLYFIANTNYCNTLKMLKLVYLLDFEHYRQTGESVTGLDYKAWKMGPVADRLWREIKKPPTDFASYMDVLVKTDELTDVPKRRDFSPRKEFNKRVLTPRQLRILERLALFFRDLTAEQMSAYTHGPKMPWKKVFDPKAGRLIPYELGLSGDPIVKEEPTISKDEADYREDALNEVRAHSE